MTRTARSTTHITATAGPRRPPKAFWSLRISGQVATTIIVAQIPGPRNGRITHRLPTMSRAMATIARTVRVRSFAWLGMPLPCSFAPRRTSEMEPPRYRLPAMPRQPCRKRENADPATGRRLEVGSVRTLLLSTCLAASLAAAAPGTPTGSASLSAADRQGAVEAIATLVSKHYVFPEKRAAIVAAIQEQLRSGAYDGLDGPALSARLTDDLRHAGQDGHLWVKWSPEVYEARRKVKPGVESTDLEDAMGLRLNQGYTELKIL